MYSSAFLLILLPLALASNLRVGAGELRDAAIKLVDGSLKKQEKGCSSYDVCSACLLGEGKSWFLGKTYRCAWKPSDDSDDMMGDCVNQEALLFKDDTKVRSIYEAQQESAYPAAYIEPTRLAEMETAYSKGQDGAQKLLSQANVLCGSDPLALDGSAGQFPSEGQRRYLVRTGSYTHNEGYFERADDGSLSEEAILRRLAADDEQMESYEGKVATVDENNFGLEDIVAYAEDPSTYTFTSTGMCQPDFANFVSENLAAGKLKPASPQTETHTLSSGATIEVHYDANTPASVLSVMRTSVSDGVAILNKYPALQLDPNPDDSTTPVLKVYLLRFQHQFMINDERKIGALKTLYDSVAYHDPDVVHIFHTPSMACMKTSFSGGPYAVADAAAGTLGDEATADQKGLLRGTYCFLHEYMHGLHSRKGRQNFCEVKDSSLRDVHNPSPPSNYAIKASSPHEFYAESAVARVAIAEGYDAVVAMNEVNSAMYTGIFGDLAPAGPLVAAPAPSPLVQN